MLSPAFVLLLLTSWNFRYTFAEDPYCLADDTNPYVKFASKTPYNLVRGSFSGAAMVPEGCEAVQVWHLSRHGTRYPSDGDILDFQFKLPRLQVKIIEASEGGRGKVCDADMSYLKKWNIGDLNVTWDSILAPEGYVELEELSSRYKVAIPTLLDQPFSNESFVFRHTASQRTEASARSYARGLFGEKGSTIYIPKPLDPDPMIKFYKLCDKYIREVDENPNATIEATKFEEGPEMAAVMAEASSRLGFNVTLGDVEVMFDACRYYKAWVPPALSPWCAAFTPENLKILEYWQDLIYYYEDGYGHSINYECACPPIQDLIQQFRNVVEKGEGPKGLFYFTHSGAINKVIARLGLYKDDIPLTHDRMDPDRHWRTSEHGSFASNIAFTLSNCGSKRGWWVSAMISETAVQLPGCPSEEGCTWNDFLRTYVQFEQCDFDTICENESILDDAAGLWNSVKKTIKEAWNCIVSIFQ